MNEYESADGRLGNHRAAVQKGYSQGIRGRQQPEYVPLESVVRATGISGRRFDDLELRSIRNGALHIFIKP